MYNLEFFCKGRRPTGRFFLQKKRKGRRPIGPLARREVIKYVDRI